MKLSKVKAGHYEARDHRGRHVEVVRVLAYRGRVEWHLIVDGEKVGDWPRKRDAARRAGDLDLYLASEFLRHLALSHEHLAIYEDFDEQQRLRRNGNVYRAASEYLDGGSGARRLRKLYDDLNERYRVRVREFEERRAERRAS